MRFVRLWRATIVAVTTMAFSILPPETRAATARDVRHEIPRGEVFLVVVNERNGVETMSRAVVSRMFLKKVSRWDSGAVALPVDLPPDSPTREAFSRRVLSKSVTSIKAYWQQQIFSGRDVPPPEKVDDAAVLEFVQSNPAAIAYVSSVAPLPRGVRVLTITD
jgi:ABC-type phosphate transport system substrate-binding protein